MGSFDNYRSLLSAVNNVAIHTNSDQVNDTLLNSTFPQFYKPTWKELFDSVARQTKSSWKYDIKSDNWMFTKPAMPLPFEVKIAKRWTSEDWGAYVYFKHPSVPVGMFIYIMGTYSSTDKVKVQEDIALRFARLFKNNATVKDMTTVEVGKYDALHFKQKAPQTGVIMRQWTIVESGTAFNIVSAIKPELEKKILPDVEEMLKSFTVKTELNKKADKPDTGIIDIEPELENEILPGVEEMPKSFTVKTEMNKKADKPDAGDPNQENTEVSFYLVKNKIPLEDLLEFDLSEVILDESPVFTAKDIIEYSQSDHSIKLTEEAYKKYNAVGMYSVFAFCVDNKPVYLGHISAKYHILRVDGISAHRGKDLSNEIQIQYRIYLNGSEYIGPDESKEDIDDPRQNKLILDSLRKSNKLVK